MEGMKSAHKNLRVKEKKGRFRLARALSVGSVCTEARALVVSYAPS